MTAPHSTAITISGVGHHLPEGVETNEMLCRNLDVTPEWILEKTGIEQRYIAGSDDTASSYAVAAAERALAMADVSASDVDMIVVCTFSGDYVYPPLSSSILCYCEEDRSGRWWARAEVGG